MSSIRRVAAVGIILAAVCCILSFAPRPQGLGVASISAAGGVAGERIGHWLLGDRG